MSRFNACLMGLSVFDIRRLLLSIGGGGARSTMIGDAAVCFRQTALHVFLSTRVHPHSSLGVAALEAPATSRARRDFIVFIVYRDPSEGPFLVQLPVDSGAVRL